MSCIFEEFNAYQGSQICLRSRGAPSNRLMGMCRSMESHFYDWIDYWIAFSIAFKTRMGSHIFGILEARIFRQLGISNREDFYFFYFITNKCDNLFQDDLDKRFYKVDA